MPTEISTESVAVAEPVKPAFNQEDTSTWTPEQKQEFQDSGKVTAPPKKQNAESATASSSESKTQPAPKGKTAAESGAAPKQEKPGKATADERIDQLTAHNKRLEAQIEELRKATPAPKVPAEAAKPQDPPKRPNPFKWTGTPEEYEKAQDDWDAYQRNQAIFDSRRQLQAQEVTRQNQEMLKQASEKYPDAEPKIKEATSKLMADDVPFFVKAFVNESEVLGDLLYTLSDDTTRAKLIETAKANPGKALRVLRDMEQDIEKALKAAKSEAGTEPEKKSPAEPEKPRVAPKTPPEVGGRGTATEDPAKSAARNGNFAAFEEAQNRRVRASLG